MFSCLVCKSCVCVAIFEACVNSVFVTVLCFVVCSYVSHSNLFMSLEIKVGLRKQKHDECFCKFTLINDLIDKKIDCFFLLAICANSN